MKTVITALVLCGMTSGLLAQQEVPKALIAAKKVYVVNASSDGAKDEVKDELKDEVTKALISWGRFTIVDNSALSDITITMGKPMPFKGMPMTITDSKSGKQLWQTAHKNIWGWPTTARTLVSTLRSYLERKR